ncbi:ATP-binding response regulator [Aliamphritea ceti]|uniref:ATP-binding response regulator n=1 Tax=Aliamphritea ceti TaxID=1524258 RepID=UPI0021C2D517|nr:response regulator [Aliamphritea ceti]
MTPWKVLIVDDEEGIHGITRMIFRGYEFEQRGIELISAMNGTEARKILAEQQDIALALLDVVMETDHEGLQLVDFIRNQLNNQDIRVILRTGHPGYAPEAQVIVNYDINDYLSKAELSASRLLTSVVVALRSYRDIKTARQQADQPASEGQKDSLLQSAAGELQQQMTPLLQQSRRLQQLELNPVARDLSHELHARQQRLHNSVSLLHSPAITDDHQQVSLSNLLNEVLQIFLPQSRREGWLLDYSLDEQLPAQLNSSPAKLQQLLISATELAILQAKGHDLKLSVSMSGTSQLQFSLTQLSGQPVFIRTPWSQHLQQQLHNLCQQLKGQLLDAGDQSAIRCLLPLTS